MSQIVTGDAVLLDLRPARVPTRALADLIDIAIMITLAWGWDQISSGIGGSEAGVRVVSLVGYIIVSFGYLITLETLLRGRTIGAIAMGLRTVRDDGGTIGFRHALMRGLAFWLVDYSLYTGFLLGTVVSILNPQGKRVGDLLAGTIVIRVRAPRASEPVPTPPPELAEWMRRVHMSGIGDEQFAAMRAVLQRHKVMRKDQRARLLGHLATQVWPRVAPPPPPNTTPEGFLAALVAENRRRAEERILAKGVPTAEELPQGWR